MGELSLRLFISLPGPLHHHAQLRIVLDLEVAPQYLALRGVKLPK